MRTLPTFWLRTLLSKHCQHSCPPVTSLLQACLSSSVPVWQRNARLCGGFDRWLQGLGWDHIALVCLSAPSPTCNKGIKQGGEQPYMLAFWQCLKYRWKPAFFSLTLAPGVTDSLVRCARETSSHPWRAVQSLQGFLSLAPLLRLQTRGPINANCGTFSEVDRCPLGTEHSPSPCRRYGSVWDLTSCFLEKKRYFCCGQEVG